jgi:hypothetical protein
MQCERPICQTSGAASLLCTQEWLIEAACRIVVLWNAIRTQSHGMGRTPEGRIFLRTHGTGRRTAPLRRLCHRAPVLGLHTAGVNVKRDSNSHGPERNQQQTCGARVFPAGLSHGRSDHEQTECDQTPAHNDGHQRQPSHVNPQTDIRIVLTKLCTEANDTLTGCRRIPVVVSPRNEGDGSAFCSRSKKSRSFVRAKPARTRDDTVSFSATSDTQFGFATF